MQFGIRPCSRHLDDSEVWKLSRMWLSNCMSQHVRCRPKKAAPNVVFSRGMMDLELCVSPRNLARSFPTRLIDLGNVQAPTLRPRLVLRDVDFDHTWTVTSYKTLSHCWGKCNRLELRKDNFEAIRNGIIVQDLPETFSEAMVTAKSLGCRFIWIDSLCIIQDSPEDWSQQSLLMSEVYSNSACNIYALDAKDDAVGFLLDRDPTFVEPFVVQAELKNTVPFLVTHMSTRGRNLYPAGVLSTRGWVLQEQLLSPRCLLFDDRGVSWQCRELEASETYPSGSAVSPHFNSYPYLSTVQCVLSNTVDDRLLFPRSPPSTAQLFSWDAPQAQIWMQLVNEYTGRSLSVSSDKLTAIAGLAQALSPRLGRYYAGMWARLLPWSLLWYAETAGPGPASALRAPEWRAPSWSWASVDAQISHIFGRLVYEYQKVLVYVRHVSTIPVKGGSEFGCVSAGRLVLSGFLGTATWDHGLFVDPNEPGDWTFSTEVTQHDFRLIIDDEICGSVNFDESCRGDQPPPKAICFLPVCNGILHYSSELTLSDDFLENESLANPGLPMESFRQDTATPSKDPSHVIAGLILAPGGEGGAYKRLGLFEMVGDEGQLRSRLTRVC